MALQSESVCRLIDDGHVVARVAASEHGAVAFAAVELRNHLSRMAGRAPRQRLQTGETVIYLQTPVRAADDGVSCRVENLAEDAFHLDIRPDCIHVLGGSDRAVLYGVYELLSRLGCRWFAPGLDHVPDTTTASLPCGAETLAPAFEYRDILCADIRDPLWMARNRLNGHFCPIPDCLGGHHAYGLHVHTFYRLAPPGQYFEKHPEYFSLVDGKRTGFGAQLCLTNPEVLDVLTENLLAKMAAAPEYTIWSVSQNDWNGACECADCRAVVEAEGAEAGPLLRFVNAVAERTSKVYPDKLISTLAYTYTIDAPQETTFVHPNVRIRLCPIKCCQAHPFGTCDDANSNQFLQAFRAWSKLTDQIYIWHYSTDFHHLLLPMPNFDELAGNIGFYNKHGVHGVFLQAGPGGDAGVESGELRNWLCAQLLWNPDQDIWELADEWLQGVFGDAAKDVRGYYDLFHTHVRNNPDCHSSCYIAPDHATYDPELLKRAAACLAGACNRVPPGLPEQHLRKLRAGIRYGQLMQQMQGVHDLEGDQLRGPGEPDLVRAFDELVAELNDLGVEGLNEGPQTKDAARRYRARIATQPVVRLEDDDQELGVAPTLGGRAMSWQVDGVELLQRGDPDWPHTAYPYNGGYAEMVVLGPHAWRAGDLDFDASFDDDALVCRAVLDPGLELVRRYRLAAGELAIESSLRNQSGHAVRLFLITSLNLHLPDWESLILEQSGQSDRCARDGVPDGLDQAHVFGLDGSSGDWTLRSPARGISGSFDGATLESLVIARDSQRPNLAIISLRGPEAELPAAGVLTIRQAMRVRAQ